MITLPAPCELGSNIMKKFSCKHRSLKRRWLRRVVASMSLGLALVGSTGCQSLMKAPTFTSPTEWFKSKSVEEKHGVPQRMVVLWTDDVFTQIGKPPTRGFGARIYFYNEQDKPIPVEGQLVVYGYDDSNTQHGAQRVPDRKFMFNPEEFKQHYSESQIGSSYSIWVPWDGVDGPRRDISLVPVFTSSTGKIVVGPQTVNVLTARTAEGRSQYNQIQTSSRSAVPTVQPTSHVAPGGETPSHAQPAAGQNRGSGSLIPRPRTKATTIPVTGSMSERLRTAPVTPWPMLPPSPNNSATTTMPTSDFPPAAGALPAAPTLPQQPAVHYAPPRSPVPTSPSVPSTPAALPTPQSPAESPFLRPSRLTNP